MSLSPRAGLDREKVLAAAAELVDRGDPERLTATRLAARLRIRPPSLYNHIRGLEQLQHDLAVRALREMAAYMRAAAAGGAGYEARSAIAHAYRDFARMHPGLYAMSLRSGGQGADYAAAAQEVVAVVLASCGRMASRGRRPCTRPDVSAAPSMASPPWKPRAVSASPWTSTKVFHASLGCWTTGCGDSNQPRSEGRAPAADIDTPGGAV